MKLKNKRIEAGFTQKQIAEKIGISVCFYQAIETGKKKGNIDVWTKIEEILNAKLCELRDV